MTIAQHKHTQGHEGLAPRASGPGTDVPYAARNCVYGAAYNPRSFVSEASSGGMLPERLLA